MGSGQGIDGGREFQRVAETLLSRMSGGVYPVGSFLPPQRELAEELGVSRDTVQRVLRMLADENWIESRQGRGSRVLKSQRIHSSGASTAAQGKVYLGDFVGAAFRQPEVTLDVFTLSSESLDAHIRVQSELIRAGRIQPQRIAMRMLLPSSSVELPYLRAQGAPDQRLRERMDDITRRHTSSLQDAVFNLKQAQTVPSVDLEIRHVPLAPTNKLYLLNGNEAVFGPYKVLQRTIHLAGDEEIEALDVLGLDAELTHFEKDDDDTSVGSVFVSSMQNWFDSVWNLLSQ
ncbi:winged helix-turn-helix domain-containing protein [Streptomyces sporangiiformans]|uniref:GntR family transcriptional regulator n=1 Tax=Streptomyces sporangiiformans TaxID=2315329 RepID=A0A505DCD7_9ACTN|nr:winged helix-turn-helix domain-containing protein [Streptomyces sporangiiformans]TPQ22233.1 GntR family transcriptional regulator [Streptomyces sporangiiformans]